MFSQKWMMNLDVLGNLFLETRTIFASRKQPVFSRRRSFPRHRWIVRLRKQLVRITMNPGYPCRIKLSCVRKIVVE